MTHIFLSQFVLKLGHSIKLSGRLLKFVGHPRFHLKGEVTVTIHNNFAKKVHLIVHRSTVVSAQHLGSDVLASDLTLNYCSMDHKCVQL